MRYPDISPEKEKIILSALPHVAFDGWSEDALIAASADAGIEVKDAKALFPKGGVDLAKGFHQLGDAQMVAAFETADTSHLKIREKITLAVRLRIQAVADKEAVRRGSTLFALPQHAGDGAKLIWETCDQIWTCLGDTSRDVNWYTKRATLSAVYSATVLFWLGDESDGHQDTWDFLDRRIENVMQFEKFKGQIQQNPLMSKLAAGPLSFLSKIKAPSDAPRDDLPGYWNDKT